MKKTITRAQWKIPNHVGIIMDGNGRWAKKRLLPRSFGHKSGMERMISLADHVFDLGVKRLTLYALSTENLSRPADELKSLFDLFRRYFMENVQKLIDEKIGVKIIGDITVLPDDLQQLIIKAEEESKQYKDRMVNIALNYGAKQEILRAVNLAIEKGKKITQEEFSDLLYTAGQADPDLIIRTGEEKRLSNFLLYQSAYSELYFTDTLFPDFSDEEFDKAIIDYSLRERRFGKV